MGPDGRIAHTGSFKDAAEVAAKAASGSLPLPLNAQMQVDESHRRLCARIHSAGHLLDAAMERTMASGDVELPPLKAQKGYHFLKGAYVEFKGTVPAPQREVLKEVCRSRSSLCACFVVLVCSLCRTTPEFVLLHT